jgi:hypothetical protein
VEKRIEAALEAAQEMAVARGNSAIAAVGYFSERRFNLRVVGLNVSLERIGEYWANRFSRTIRSSQPVNGCWVEVHAFGRLMLANEIRQLICSKLPAIRVQERKHNNPGSSLENGEGNHRRRFRHLDGPIT